MHSQSALEYALYTLKSAFGVFSFSLFRLRYSELSILNSGRINEWHFLDAWSELSVYILQSLANVDSRSQKQGYTCWLLKKELPLKKKEQDKEVNSSATERHPV